MPVPLAFHPLADFPPKPYTYIRQGKDLLTANPFSVWSDSYKFLIAVFFLFAANKIAAFPKYGETTINGLPNMGDEIEPKHSREIP